MRASVAGADAAAMVRRNLAHGALIAAVVSFIGIGFWYSSTQPSRMERIVACVDKLGYPAYSYHDDGVEQLTGQDPDIDGPVRRDLPSAAACESRDRPYPRRQV